MYNLEYLKLFVNSKDANKGIIVPLENLVHRLIRVGEYIYFVEFMYEDEDVLVCISIDGLFSPAKPIYIYKNEDSNEYLVTHRDEYDEFRDNNEFCD